MVRLGPGRRAQHDVWRVSSEVQRVAGKHFVGFRPMLFRDIRSTISLPPAVVTAHPTRVPQKLVDPANPRSRHPLDTPPLALLFTEPHPHSFQQWGIVASAAAPSQRYYVQYPTSTLG